MKPAIYALSLAICLGLGSGPARAQEPLYFVLSTDSSSSILLRHEVGTDRFDTVATIGRLIGALASDSNGRLLAATNEEPFASILTLDPLTGTILDEMPTDVQILRTRGFSALTVAFFERPDGAYVLVVRWSGPLNVHFTRIFAVDPTHGTIIQQADFDPVHFSAFGHDAESLFTFDKNLLIRLDLDKPSAYLYEEHEPVDGLLGYSLNGAARDERGRTVMLRGLGDNSFQLFAVDTIALTAEPLGPRHETRAKGPAFGPPISEQPIPTLGSRGLLALATTISLFALFILRTRRRTRTTG
jgi:hypothetical protein